jgi:predicted AlkP superfamily phosphohydrolase/phosphomutase
MRMVGAHRGEQGASARAQLTTHLGTATALGLVLGTLWAVALLIVRPSFLGTVGDFALVIVVVVAFALCASLPLLGARMLSARIDDAPPFALHAAAITSLGVVLALTVGLYALTRSRVLAALPVAAWALSAPLLVGVARRGPAMPGRQLAGRALVCLGVAVLAYAARWPVRNFRVPAKVFVFGVDAATWTIMDPLIAQGRMPNFARLKAQSSHGKLRSTEPMLSPILWTTLATGKVSAKHGVKDFYDAADSVRCPRIWDLFEKKGASVGIFKWLVTWPPHPVNGFLVPDILARDATTFPPEYAPINALRIAEKSQTEQGALTQAQLVWSLMDMGLRLGTIRSLGWALARARWEGSDERTTYPIKRRGELWINRDVYMQMLRRHDPEFTVFYDNGVDTLSHRYWKYMEPQFFGDVSPQDARTYGDVITTFYEHIDDVLGELLRHFPEETLLVVISDHGQQAAREVRSALYTPKLSAMLEGLGIADIVYGITVSNRSYVRAKDEKNGNALTRARSALEGVRIDDGGEPLLEFGQDESGLIVSVRGDRVSWDRRVRVGARVLGMKELVYEHPPYTGAHHPDGIVLLRGANVKRGVEVQGASILDVVPTILYLSGMPIGDEVDGTPILAAATDEYRVAQAPAYEDEEAVERAPAQRSQFDSDVEERLRGLGYVQ